MCRLSERKPEAGVGGFDLDPGAAGPLAESTGRNVPIPSYGHLYSFAPPTGSRGLRPLLGPARATWKRLGPFPGGRATTRRDPFGWPARFDPVALKACVA